MTEDREFDLFAEVRDFANLGVMLYPGCPLVPGCPQYPGCRAGVGGLIAEERDFALVAEARSFDLLAE